MRWRTKISTPVENFLGRALSHRAPSWQNISSQPSPACPRESCSQHSIGSTRSSRRPQSDSSISGVCSDGGSSDGGRLLCSPGVNASGSTQKEYPPAPASLAEMYETHLAIQQHPLVASEFGGRRLQAQVMVPAEPCLYALFSSYIVAAPGDGLSAAAINLWQLEPEIGFVMEPSARAPMAHRTPRRPLPLQCRGRPVHFRLTLS